MPRARRDPVTLEFISRQQERLLAEVAALRDDMRVLTAIVLRHETMLIRLDETLNGVLQQITAMVAQHQRFADRLSRLEETRQ